MYQYEPSIRQAIEQDILKDPKMKLIVFILGGAQVKSYNKPPKQGNMYNFTYTKLVHIHMLLLLWIGWVECFLPCLKTNEISWFVNQLGYFASLT